MSAKRSSVAILLLCVAVGRLDASCLVGQLKNTPGPEADLHDCALYSDNACCDAESLRDELPNSPRATINHFYWNRCGMFSPKCEKFMKQIACFYLCSPQASHWAQPSNPTGLQNVPLCQGFCDQWYSACESDLTCSKDWLADWKANVTGNTCIGKCTPFSEVYRDGRDLCESLWGDSIQVRTCDCLNLDQTDERSLEALSREDSTKGCPGSQVPLRAKRSSLLRKLRRSVRKRSIFVEEMEGSGSGLHSD